MRLFAYDVFVCRNFSANAKMVLWRYFGINDGHQKGLEIHCGPFLILCTRLTDEE